MNGKKSAIIEVDALVYLPEELINSADLPNGKMSALRIKTDIKKELNSGEYFYIYDHRAKTITYSNSSIWPLKVLVNSCARVVVMKKDNGSKYINLFDVKQNKKEDGLIKTGIVLREAINPLSTTRQSKLVWSIGGYFSNYYYMIALEKTPVKNKNKISKGNLMPVFQPI